MPSPPFLGILRIPNPPTRFRSVDFPEPENLLKQEVREPALYNAVITAIAAGASRMSEISTKVGEDTNVCAVYLKNLLELGLIRKETPYGEKTSRKSIYVIDDNMFRFGIGLFLRIVPLLPVVRLILLIDGLSRICQIIWEKYLRKSAGSIFGNCC